MLEPSTRVGRYEIKSSLGKGGMGSLYIARDPNTGRLVAVKLLAAHLDSEELKARFDLEAKALAQLNHPNIVDIYDSGQYRGAPFIVMEYVRGETLEEMIRRSAPQSESRKLRLIAQLCAGLAHAHEAGVIHRDIKPANLMVEDRSRRLKIVDFGIARVTEGLTRYGRMTRVNMQIGTPGYMSPEQIDGVSLDHRSDLFAVGVVLYELLTNTTAFSGNSTRQIERKVLEEQPPAIESIVPGLDPEIQAIVSTALQKDPANRYQSAADFAEALDAVQERLGRSESAQRARGAGPATPGKASPAPVAKGSRAEMAYQRSQEAQAEGAAEAAKRFAVEALVEDPTHEAARAFLKRVDPKRWVPPLPKPSGALPRPTPYQGTPPTQVVANDESDATLVVAPRRAVGTGWDAPPSEGAGWDSSGHTAVVRSGQTEVGGEWPDDSIAPEGFDATVVIPGHGAATGWNPSEARSYDKTIIAPPASGRRSRQGAARSRPSRPQRAFPWTAIAWGAGALTVVALGVTGAWFLLSRDEGIRLTIEKPDGGTIATGALVCGSKGNECTGTFDLESLIEFEATPDDGYRLTGFTGDCAPGGRTRMTGPRSCGATFERIPETPVVPKVRLTVSKATGGTVVGSGINCGTGGNDCAAEFEVGTVVTLTASADDGFTFRGFARDCGTGRQFSTAMNRALDCGVRFEGRPLSAPGGAGSGGTAATTAGGNPPVRRTPGTPGSGGAGAPGEGTAVAGPGRGEGGGLAGDETSSARGGATEKREPVRPPKTEAEHAKEVEDLARSDIEKTLAAWPPAYSDLDFPAIQRLFPTAPNAIRNQFRQYDALEYTYAGKPEFKQLDAASGRAVVEVDVKQVTTPKAGRKQEGDFRVTFDLFKREDSWLIGKVVTVPKKK